MNDHLTPAEDRSQNTYMAIVLLIWLAGFLGFICGWVVRG